MADRAARNQTVPSKLHAFTWTYFEDATQIGIMRESLRPSLRAWLTFVDSKANVDEALDVFVQWIGEDSKHQLIKAVEIGEGENFDRAIQNLLHAWNSTRAARTADYIIQHGLTKDGQLQPPPITVVERPTVSTKGTSLAWKERWLKTKRAQLQ
jgi:hypothetical protein